MVRLIVFLISLCFSQLSLAASPSRIEARYDVLKGSVKVATITETYTRTENNYHIDSVTKPYGLLSLFKAETIHVTSQGTVTTQGLRPDTFIHQRKLDTKRDARADFNWQEKLITLNDKSGKRTVPLAAGTQDRLSAMYQFIFTELSDATSLKFTMTAGSKVDDYSYQITANKSVTVPLGTFKALYLANLPQADKSRTEIWLAVEHAYFPYKLDITDSEGGRLSQVLTQFQLEP